MSTPPTGPNDPQYPHQPQTGGFPPPAPGYPGASQPGYPNPGYPAQPGGYPAQPGGFPAPGAPQTGGVPAGGYFPAADAGAPGQFPPGMVPPGQPAKKSKAWVRPVIIVVVLAIIGVVVFLSTRNDVQNAEAGDCIQVVDEADSDYKVVDCTAPEANYRVLSLADNSAACEALPDYDVYFYLGDKGGSASDADKYWCSRVVAVIGDCLQDDLDKVPCTDATAAYKVAQVLTGTQDDTGCPENATLTRKYAGDNSVICLEETG